MITTRGMGPASVLSTAGMGPISLGEVIPHRNFTNNVGIVDSSLVEQSRAVVLVDLVGTVDGLELGKAIVMVDLADVTDDLQWIKARYGYGYAIMILGDEATATIGLGNTDGSINLDDR